MMTETKYTQWPSAVAMAHGNALSDTHQPRRKAMQDYKHASPNAYRPEMADAMPTTAEAICIALPFVGVWVIVGYMAVVQLTGGF
jgi:hypothetical protein